MNKITGKITLEKALEIKGAQKILEKHHFPCLHCPMAQQEMSKLDIGTVCEMYGLPIDKVLLDLNKANGSKK